MDGKEPEISNLSRNELDSLCKIANQLRPFAPRKQSPFHPLLHIPFLVMSNAVLNTAGYHHLVTPLYPPRHFEKMDKHLPLRLNGETMYEIFCCKSKDSLYKLSDRDGTPVNAREAHKHNDSVMHAFFNREYLASACDKHNVLRLPYLYVRSENEVVIKGFKRKHSKAKVEKDEEREE